MYGVACATAYVSIRQHTAAYGSIRLDEMCAEAVAGGAMCGLARCIRQHTAAYVSIRAEAVAAGAMYGLACCSAFCVSICTLVLGKQVN